VGTVAVTRHHGAMTRLPRLSKAVLVVTTTLAAVLPAAAAHSSAPAAPSLERSALAPPVAPRAVSLVGTTLRLEGGRTAVLPRSAGRWPVLLGTVDRGWVLASDNTFRLVRPNGKVEGLGRRNSSELFVDEALFGDRIVSASIDQGDEFGLQVRDLQGKKLLDAYFSYIRGSVMDAGNGQVYVGGRGGLRAIAEGTGTVTRVLREPVALVDLDQDTLFVGSRQAPLQVGPTSFAEPGTPPWRARFTPVAISSDGEYVVGREGTVRAMDDGHVVRRVPVTASRDGSFRFLGWGSDREVLLQTSAGKRAVLVSCAVPRGACRTSGSTTGLVSLPTSHAGPYLQP
jgi:hypothetical protein